MLGSRLFCKKPDLSLLGSKASHNVITPKWELVFHITTLLWSSQSLNSFHKSFWKVWRGNSMATPTVHNRGRGYSNSLTLCRDCTLSPQHSIHPSGTNPEFTILSMRIINPNLSITRPSISTSPVSLASQPWPTVILGTTHVDNLHKVASAQTLAAREPILRYISFQSSPTQSSGIVVVR